MIRNLTSVIKKKKCAHFAAYFLCVFHFYWDKGIIEPEEEGGALCGTLHAWSVLGPGLSQFSFTARSSGDCGGRRGGDVLNPSAFALQQWLALSGPDIRPVIVKPKLISQEKVLNLYPCWTGFVFMICLVTPPNPPPSPASISPSIVLNAPLPPFHSRVVEQDPGEIIELQFWNRLNSVSTEQSGAAACQASSWAGLTTLSFRGGNVEWRGKGGRALQEVPMHY